MSNLNLDALEREGTSKPFTITLGGRDYALVGPKDRDPREILTFLKAANDGDFASALNVMVADDDVEEFLANKLPMWKLEILAMQYAEHFGLKVEDLGESSASPTS